MKVVLLAAGRSSRTTALKQLYRVQGEYLVNIQIKKVLDHGFDVVLVLGYKRKEIETVLKYKTTIIYNEAYEEGMFSSVQKAFASIKDEDLILCHIDRPIADKAVFEALLESESEIAVASYEHHKAPPILIRASMRPALLKTPHKRLDHWIASTEKASYIEVDDKKILYNANTDAQLRRYFD